MIILRLALIGLYITLALAAFSAVFMFFAFIVAGVTNLAVWLWKKL